MRTVDKSDLTSSSTEFCFSPGGIYTVESFGVVLGADANIAASARVRAVIRVFEQVPARRPRPTSRTIGIDPEGKELSAMRDICSLPESRNAIDPPSGTSTVAGPHLQGNADYDLATSGLFAATYDGQLTFNVITKVICADGLQGTYVGFIDRTLEGKRAVPGQTTQRGIISTNAALPSVRALSYTAPYSPSTAGAPGPGPMVVLKSGTTGGPTNPNAYPDFVNGSDLHPLAAFCGRQGRAFTFDQDQGPSAYPNSGVILPTHVSVTGTTINVTDTTLITRAGGLVAELVLTAQAVVPNYSYDTCDTQSFEAWFKPDLNETGSTVSQMLVDWQSGDPVGCPVPAPGDGTLDTGTITAPVGSLAALLSGISFPARSHNDLAYVGAHASLQIWLDTPAASATPPSSTLNCKFTLSVPDAMYSQTYYGDSTGVGPGAGPDYQPAPVGTSPHTIYSRQWTATNAIFAGTWHHFLFSMQRPDTGADHNENTFFYADGVLVTSTDADVWPTETSADARMVRMGYDRLTGELYDFRAQVFAALTPVGVVMGSTSIPEPPIDPEQFRENVRHPHRRARQERVRRVQPQRLHGALPRSDRQHRLRQPVEAWRHNAADDVERGRPDRELPVALRLLPTVDQLQHGHGDRDRPQPGDATAGCLARLHEAHPGGRVGSAGQDHRLRDDGVAVAARVGLHSGRRPGVGRARPRSHALRLGTAPLGDDGIRSRRGDTRSRVRGDPGDHGLDARRGRRDPRAHDSPVGDPGHGRLDGVARRQRALQRVLQRISCGCAGPDNRSERVRLSDAGSDPALRLRARDPSDLGD